MKVVKVFSHNVVLASDESGRKVVLQGKGLGYNRRRGDTLDPQQVEHRFLPAGTATTTQLAGLIAEIPREHIALAEKVLGFARADLHRPLDDRSVIALADHISFALQRQQKGEVFDYPLEWEVRQLYPREVALGAAALDLIETSTGIRLPAQEAVPLAMHFVNAQIGVKPLVEMVRMTELLGQIVEMIKGSLEIDVADESLELARLAAHLRYLFLDHARGINREAPIGDLTQVLKAQGSHIFGCAETIVDLMRREMGWNFRQDETLYIALHLHRFAARAGQPCEAEPHAPL